MYLYSYKFKFKVMVLTYLKLHGQRILAGIYCTCSTAWSKLKDISCTDSAMARKLRLSVRKNDECKKRRTIRHSLVVSIQRDGLTLI